MDCPESLRNPGAVHLSADPFTGARYAFGDGNPISNIEQDGHMPCAATSAGEVCGSIQYLERWSATQQKTSSGSRSGSGSSGGPSIVQISPHVYASKDDPNLGKLQAAWNWAVSNYGQPHGAEAEYSTWMRACAISPYHSACTGQFGVDVNPMNTVHMARTEEAFHSGFKFLVLAGVVRSLANPASMAGATLDQVRALIPSGWQEASLAMGSGIRFLAPGGRSPGSRGFIEYNEGAPEVGDPLHAGPSLRVSVGGLQYRAALSGNPVLEEPSIPNLQPMGQGSAGPVDLGGEIDFGAVGGGE